MRLNILAKEEYGHSSFDFPSNLGVLEAAWFVAKHFNMHEGSQVGDFSFQKDDLVVDTSSVEECFEENDYIVLVDLRN